MFLSLLIKLLKPFLRLFLFFLKFFVFFLFSFLSSFLSHLNYIKDRGITFLEFLFLIIINMKKITIFSVISLLYLNILTSFLFISFFFASSKIFRILFSSSYLMSGISTFEWMISLIILSYTSSIIPLIS
jgi:hypothetical protein